MSSRFCRLMTLVVVCSLMGVVSAHAQDGRGPCPATVELTGTTGAPFAGPASDARVMSVYLASEFPSCDGGTIVGVSFYMAGSYTMNNLTIRLQQTNLTALPSNSFGNSGWTVCYQEDTSISQGWRTFVFTTPFGYTASGGTPNLLVDFSYNSSTPPSGDVGLATYTTTGLRSLMMACNNCGCPGTIPQNWTTCAGCTRYEVVPRVRFFFGGACCQPDGSCTVTRQEDCTGAWLGVGTTCTPNPCIYHVAGDFQSWNPSSDPMTETPPGSGIWSRTYPAPATDMRHEWKVTLGSWSWSAPPVWNCWLYAPYQTFFTVTYDTNTYADGWLPATGRLGVLIDPPPEPTGWTATGNFLHLLGGVDWSNNDAHGAMQSQGNGVWMLEAPLPPNAPEVPYAWKAVATGTWDSISSDGRSVNTQDWPFLVTEANRAVRFWVDSHKGCAKIEVLPLGACCLPNGACQVYTSPTCASAGGTWVGIDAPCTPTPCPLLQGDLNCDHIVNVSDIPYFAGALIGHYTGCQLGLADMTCDGVVNGLDIPLFVACVLNGNCYHCDIVIDTVPVGNPGNAGEWSGESYGGYGPDRICGAVDYVYNIGKYEVTAGQYTAFLNAVAGVDTYGLYNTDMWSDSYGCKIERYAGDGTPGNPYQYRVAGDWANRPVNYVSYWDACRFANWLHNGQPAGTQGPGTTETGAYTLNGYNGADGREIQRNSGWTWAVTSEDEWYKAAYHKNDGVTGNYWDYPMGSSALPNNGNPGGDTGNSANFYDGDDTIGSPYWRTEVGYFGLSDSPYGTFDQGGNVWEWNESVVDEGTGYASRGLRGGSFDYWGGHLHASIRDDYDPAHEYYGRLGFRVSEVHH